MDDSGSQQYLLDFCYVIYGITMIFVVLGFYSRVCITGFLVPADSCIMIAVCLFTGKLMTVHYLRKANIGLHSYVLSDDQISEGRKVAWISVILLFLIMCATRCSIFFLYAQIPAAPLHIKIIRLLGALVFIVCGIVEPLVTALACRPPSIIWGFTSPGDHRCINIIAFNYFSAAFDISINFLALLPIPTLIRLHTHRRRKITLVIVFCCGIVIIVPTIAREVYNYFALTGPDFSWNWAPVALVMDMQISTSVICACVPSIWSILKSWSDCNGDRQEANFDEDRMESQTGIVMQGTRGDQRASDCGDSNRVVTQESIEDLAQ